MELVDSKNARRRYRFMGLPFVTGEICNEDCCLNGRTRRKRSTLGGQDFAAIVADVAFHKNSVQFNKTSLTEHKGSET